MWWIQSVYVHADYRRRGFFRALYQHVAQEAKQENAVGIRLYVDTHNTKAQETVSPLRILSCHDCNSLREQKRHRSEVCCSLPDNLRMECNRLA